MPIDAKSNPFPSEDPVEMLRAITMAFTLLVARQPHMMVSYKLTDFVEFPFECFRLSASQDPQTGTTTFMLIDAEHCEVQ